MVHHLNNNITELLSVGIFHLSVTFQKHVFHSYSKYAYLIGKLMNGPSP